MKKLTLILIAVIISLGAYSQEWQRLLWEGERDFQKIQEAFYNEWDGKILEKGNGYKQFKRWEYKNAPRLINGQIANIASSYSIRKKENARASKSRIQSSGWEALGPYSWQNGTNGYNPGIGRVNSIDIHPTDPDILFVGTAGGGLWKSETGGNSWTTLSEEFPILGVTDFFIDPADPDKMYVLTGDAYGADTYSHGVFKSTDGGVSWANNSNFSPQATDFRRMYRMIVDPNDSDILLIAGTSGIWKSEDGAESWTMVRSGSFTDIEFKPGNSSVVYASTSSSSIFNLSQDGGDTWSNVSTPIQNSGRTAIGVSPDNPAYVYILASSSNSLFGGVYRSTDSGQTFSLQSDSPNIFGYDPEAADDRGQGWYDLAIAVNPDDVDDIYVSGIHIWNSKDGGESWQDGNDYQILNFWVYNPSNTNNYVHADNHTLDFLNGELYAGCDGGIWKSSNLGQSWEDLSEGLNNTQLYRLGLDPNDENVIIAGAQDNGSNIMINGTWTHIFGADGMEALIDHTDGDIVYSTYQFGGLLRYTNRGAGSIEDIAGDLNGTGAWVTPYMLDPMDNNFLYAGYQNVWKYDNSSGVWEEISDFGSSSNITSLKVSSTNPDYMYASTGYSTYSTTDGGENWTNISAGLPSEYLSYITISEENPEKLWVTFSGYNDKNKVYESSNGGNSWTNVSEGLPNLPINCIVHQRNSDDQLYVGTDIGVYQKTNAGDWEPWFDGLPNVIVNELEIHYASKKIVAATYGRGLWSADIITDGSGVLQISADPITVLEGESVTFSASLENELDGYEWSFEGGTPSSSSEASPVVTYLEAGKYDVNLNGATRSEKITVLDLISIESISADFNPVDRRKSVTFSSVYEGNPSSWEWTFEGGTPSTSNDQNPTITYNEHGEFDVTLVLSGDTEDQLLMEDFISVNNVLSISEKSTHVYPSVSQDQLFIKVDAPNTTIKLISMSGEVVKEVIANEDFKMSIGNLSDGVYVLKFINGERINVVRIIKE
ncbi:MAG: PKD domain-containing protein [Ekhidna sp.]|uniref:PKD domain-containing protein n=1 Tax=Ekhidna sp. TaxID=2608089 RepID=UPI0032EF16AC